MKGINKEHFLKKRISETSMISPMFNNRINWNMLIEVAPSFEKKIAVQTGELFLAVTSISLDEQFFLWLVPQVRGITSQYLVSTYLLVA